MPKASGCAVDFCTGLHEPDGQYHASELELHPLPDGSNFAITVTRDDRINAGTIVKFRLIAGPSADREIGRDLLQTLWDANHETWEQRGLNATLNLPTR